MYETQHSNIDPADSKHKHLTKALTSTKFSLVRKLVGQTWLKNKAKCASSTALSMSPSSHTMKGDFPPSSNVTGLRLLFAANSSTILPVSVDPVKASCKGGGDSINNYYSTSMPKWHNQFWIIHIPIMHNSINVWKLQSFTMNNKENCLGRNRNGVPKYMSRFYPYSFFFFFLFIWGCRGLNPNLYTWGRHSPTGLLAQWQSFIKNNKENCLGRNSNGVPQVHIA